MVFSGQITIIPKPELRGFGGGYSLTVNCHLGFSQLAMKLGIVS